MLTPSLHPTDLAHMQGLAIAGCLTKPLTRGKINQIMQEHFGQPEAEI